MLQACQDIGAAFVAFSPVARGFLSNAPPLPQDFDARDIRRGMPRFSSPHWPANLALREGALALARQASCTLAQLSLAWLLARGPHILAIPGTTQLAHLRDNLGAASVAPSTALLAQLDGLINQRTVSGARYSAQSAAEVDTETFA